ncbi:hypothetical protein T484DRAFT_1622469, partial [Baffinella frigidus]
IRNPDPGTRNLKPENRRPKPENRDPKPETRNPKPENRNPKPDTRNPKPETRNPKPETRNPKPARGGPRPWWTRAHPSQAHNPFLPSQAHNLSHPRPGRSGLRGRGAATCGNSCCGAGWLADHSQVDALGFRYKSVNFGVERSLISCGLRGNIGRGVDTRCLNNPYVNRPYDPTVGHP